MRAFSEQSNSSYSCLSQDQQGHMSSSRITTTHVPLNTVGFNHHHIMNDWSMYLRLGSWPTSLRHCERLLCGRGLGSRWLQFDTSKGSFVVLASSFSSPHEKVERLHVGWHLHLHPFIQPVEQSTMGWSINPLILQTMFFVFFPGLPE